MLAPLNNKFDVYDHMEDHMVNYKFRNLPQEFLPEPQLKLVTGKATIKRIIMQDDSVLLNDHELTAFVDQVHSSARRLFAICVYCDSPMAFLKAMLDNGLKDTSLPLGNRDDFGSLKQQRSLIQNFIAQQRRFNTAFFSENSMEKLDDRMSNCFSIPIDHEESAANWKGKGAFGEVWKVRIHPDQRSFSCGTNSENQFAMKVTQHEGREQNYHRAMAGLNHPHLVKCLSSFILDTKYQMVYELANCDLEGFMRDNPIASEKPELTASWLAQQLAGLAGALQVVHNPESPKSPNANNSLSVPSTNPAKTGYIHDIKPENILVFTYGGNNNWLRLSDFSCAKVVDFIATVSGKRESYKTGRNPGTPTYRAPESDGATSRPYDMWSLGCVYLELLVWFFEGYSALQRFRASREGYVRPDGLIDESFYHQTSDGVIQLREPVTTKINDLSRKCSGGLRDILNAIPSLLKIKPKERLDASKLMRILRPLDTGVDPSVGTSKSPGGLGVSTFRSSNLPTHQDRSDFGGRIRVTRPNDG
ncbi:kinase-like protein [Byssothecium circinans]|uniref:Kinase-like protein n=1 Tax=Byssothecium circinans TaxID=147558 RepID=A0A6A5U7S1_9PLEO|nr:kinase-like protein [Byssothecium circinans]